MTSNTVIAWQASIVLVVVFVSLAHGSYDVVEAQDLEKRAPFSSWAGKRSGDNRVVSLRPVVAELLREIQELRAEELENGARFDKRAPFNSWAGKKRAPFSSWAGKKRAPFSSWAGKRSSEETWDDEVLDNNVKHRFKRSSDESGEETGDDDHGYARKRRGAGSFSAWGGKKRATSLRRFTRNAPIEGMRVLRPQRAAFSAWGG